MNPVMRNIILRDALLRSLFERRFFRGVHALERRQETIALLKEQGVSDSEIRAQLDAPFIGRNP